MGLSIKLNSMYLYDSKKCKLISIISTNLGGWLKLKELNTDKEFVVHRKQEYLLTKI